MRLMGKVAIVTGSGSGIGAETARLFASEGGVVVIADINEGQGQAVRQEIVDNGGTAEFVKTDVTSPDDWDALIEFTQSTFERLDILVNNAGMSNLGLSDPMSLEGWETIMNVNANSVFYGTRSAVETIVKSGGGSIVNVSSVMAILGSMGHPGYHASKGAVRSLTKATAVTYGRRGIRANSVHPGIMQPMQTGGAVSEDILKAREAFARTTPLGRMGTSSDVAQAILYLASDESSYVTGLELVVDGGFMVQ